MSESILRGFLSNCVCFRSLKVQLGNNGIVPDGKFQMLPSGELMVLNVGQADSFSTYECRVTHRLTGETKVSVRSTRIQVTGKS